MPSRAFFRWAGIPRGILAKWEAERKRRAKVIGALATS
jgi:hypothetical protein